MINEKIDTMLEELKDFYSNYWSNKRQFTYGYGSHITGYSKDSSDLDVVTICDGYLTRDIENIKDFIIGFHNKHKLEIDEEVPFEKKLICKYSMIEGAVSGEGFHYDKSGNPSVPELVLTSEYLQSDELMKRILLNTITNKSYLLSGSEKDYKYYEKKGWEKIIEIVFKMNHNAPLIKEDFLELMISNKNRTGREYMGYNNKKPVRNYLSSKIDEFFDIYLKNGILISTKKGIMYNKD